MTVHIKDNRYYFNTVPATYRKDIQIFIDTEDTRQSIRSH